MTGIGIVGVGFMGMIHYLAAQRLKTAKVAAICSRDPKKRAGDWRRNSGQFRSAGSGDEPDERPRMPSSPRFWPTRQLT